MDKKDDVSLGKTLKIDTTKYSDLDELLVSHIEAILSKTDTLMHSPKYKENAAELRSSLETQTKAKPGSAVYGFTLDRKFAGYFLLVFKLGAKAPIVEWPIKVFPDHYVLRGPTSKDCGDVVALSDAFKEMMMQKNRPKPAVASVPAAASTAPLANNRPHYNSYHHTPSSHGAGAYGHHPSTNSSMGSHHYVPHHAQPVAAHHLGGHQAAPPMHQASSSSGAPWGTPWGGASWTGAPSAGGQMGGPSGGHMTGPHHHSGGGYSSHGDSRHGGAHGGPHGGAHDAYGSRPSRAPPTPRRYMPTQGQPHPQQPYY